MRIEPFESEKHTQSWEAFIATAPMATFLHSRKFLSYHGDKFRDLSLMVYDDANALLAVFPAAQNSSDPRIVVSHPGITYGGILHQGMIGGNFMAEIVSVIAAHYLAQGFAQLVYKAIPVCYHRVPCEEDEWALWRVGAQVTRADLARTVHLLDPLRWGDKRQRGLKKSQTAGVVTERGHEYAEALWRITQDNLERKHGAAPVHSLEDIKLLLSLCPESIEYLVAKLEGEVLAGAMLFVTPTVIHVQYGSSSARGYEFDALEMVYYHAIEYAKSCGKRYFSFGISTEEQGRVLNENLDRFKKKFSAGANCYKFYTLDLARVTGLTT